MEQKELRFRKSTFSNGGAQCVEVAFDDEGGAHVRDSKDPSGAVLRFTPGEWNAFRAGVVDGQFDRG